MRNRLGRHILALLVCLLSTSAMAEALNIAVYGGSGSIGSQIVTEALSRGHNVTIVVRNPSAVKQQGVRVIQGDILDSDSVTEAMQSQDVLVNATSGQAETFHIQVAESLVRAVYNLADDAPRILWVGGATSLKPDADTPPQSLTEKSLPPYMIGHWRALMYFRGVQDYVNVSWTMLTPPMNINPGERTTEYRLGGNVAVNGEDGDSHISIEDYAVAMLDEIEDPQHIRQRFTIGY